MVAGAPDIVVIDTPAMAIQIKRASLETDSSMWMDLSLFSVHPALSSEARPLGSAFLLQMERQNRQRVRRERIRECLHLRRELPGHRHDLLVVSERVRRFQIRIIHLPDRAAV